jgi:hypothetical protein
MKKTIIALTLGTMLVLQGCYTSKPIGSVTTPDYNKRVSVSNTGMKKKGNELNVVFAIGLVGAGGYAGYQYLPLVQKQTATGHEPVRVANAAIGALSGAAISYLCDAIMGKNKTTPVVNPQQWIDRANPQYKFLNGNGQNFTIIHSSAEQNYAVKNIQDVRDFQKVFPNSHYTDNMFQQATGNLRRDEFPELISLYPSNKHIEAAKSAYIKNSSSFGDALAAAQKYPLQNADELCIPLITTTANAIDFSKQFPVSNYKKTAVINAFKQEDPTQTAMQNLKNAYGNIIYLTSDDLQNKGVNILSHYYVGMYNLTTPFMPAEFDKFNVDYAWLNFPNKGKTILSNYWNLNDKLYLRGKDVIWNFKSILANTQYEKYNISENDVKQVMAEKFQIEVKNNVKIVSENIIGQNNSEWENWKNSKYTAGMVSEQGKVNYILYGEIQNSSKYDLPVVIGGGAVLQEVITIKGQNDFLDAIVQIGAAMSGQGTTQVKDVATVTDYYYFPVISAGEKVIYSILLDFGTQMKNSGINLFDWIKGTHELNLRETKTDVRYLTTIPSRQQLEKQNTWQRLAKDGGLPAGKLTDLMRNEEVRQDIWDIRYEDYKERMREALRNSNSYSYSYDSSYSSDDDNSSSVSSSNSNGNISIANIKKISGWSDDSGMIEKRDKNFIEYSDGEMGTIYRNKEKSIYFYYFNSMGLSQGFYNTERDVIDALYVFEKYDSDTYKQWRKAHEK